MKDEYIIGVDTSCYTTSVVGCSLKGDIFFDGRTPLQVKEGERGLRQSDALFQHMQNLPPLVEALMSAADGAKPCAVAVSDRPRPVTGSYMPVFTAGVNFGAVIAHTAGVPLFRFSHQEGHIEAAVQSRQMPDTFLAFHLSGGTTELLRVERAGAGYTINIIGGSRDISAGQLIDRIGVALGLPFPCGKIMDIMAVKAAQEPASHEAFSHRLPDIHIKDTWMNLSGIETHCQRLIQNAADLGQESSFQEEISRQIFEKLKIAIKKILKKAREDTGIQDILMIGGVSESRFMKWEDQCKGNHCAMGYGTDNAAGIAKLGLKYLRQEMNKDGIKADKSITS